jgi:protein TonB
MQTQIATGTDVALGPLGSLSHLLEVDAAQRRALRFAAMAAVTVHLVLFVTHWPAIGGGQTDRAVEEPVIFVVKPHRFVPPEPPEQELPVIPRAQRVPIPDPDPLAPEPMRDFHETEVVPVIDDQVLPRVGDIPAPPPAAEPERIIAGVHVTRPVVIHRVEPTYTNAARAMRLTGVVVLELIIDERGKVAEATVLRPLGMGLSESALAAARQWRFEPSTLNGRPVSVTYHLTIRFTLENL